MFCGVPEQHRFKYNTYMDNIVSYLRDQQQSFSERSLCAVDSLVLSTISYFNFEFVDFADASGSNSVKLHDVLALSDKQRITQGNWLQDSSGTEDFWQALMASRRYRDVSVGHYVNEASDQVVKQFSAVSLFLPHEVIYLAFRGTDGSFAGWKEDFNLFFKEVIPSQESAARYLANLSSETSQPLILGGHSKGGNLAEYAALVADDMVFDRIVSVYNHDGPSFLEDPSKRISTEEYGKKLQKTVPETSIFGMILEKRSNYKVVRSTAKFIFQHEPFTWIVQGDDFLYQEALNEDAVFLDTTLDSWLKGRSAEERQLLVDTAFDLIMSTNADNWTDFHDRLTQNARLILEKSVKLDPETKKLFQRAITSLATMFKDEAVKRVLPEPPQFLEHVKPASDKARS